MRPFNLSLFFFFVVVEVEVMLSNKMFQQTCSTGCLRCRLSEAGVCKAEVDVKQIQF